MGPFTSVLLVVILVFGILMVASIPWVMMYEMWKDKDGDFMAWVLCIAWAVSGLAIGLDIIWEMMK